MLGFIDTLLVGVGLSMDAFAVSVCKGLASKRINWLRAFAIALSFGSFQALMPLIGWALGEAVQSFIEPIDHWVAFILLAAIGLKMLWDAFHEDAEDEQKSSDEQTWASFFIELILLSIATSIDALVAGISFSMANISIVWAVCVIGITTFILSLIGFVIGNKFGATFKKPATILGGVALILLGVKVLVEHLLG